MLANLELLQASLATPSTEDRQMVDSALRSSQRMSRLVSDLLLLARADAGRPARTRLRPGRDRRRRAPRSAPSGRTRARVDDERPLPVEGNPDELHRMVLNLLENAVRHTPPRLDRSSSALAPRTATARARGRRRRPGDPAEMREQVFDRFVRGDGPGRHRRQRRQRPGPGDRPRGRQLHGGTVEVGRVASRRRPVHGQLPCRIANRYDLEAL